MYDFYVLSWYGGEYEDFFDADRNYISRGQAESAYAQMVKEAEEDDFYFGIRHIEMKKAHIDENGAIVPDSGEAIHVWERKEKEVDW